jgi:hypothetical protein
MIKSHTLLQAFLFLFLINNLSSQSTPFEQVVYDHVGEPFRTGTFNAPWGAHEGLLHGVPLTYNWAQGARPSLWSNLQDYEAVSSWGQVYEWAEKSPETNVRIHIRNHKFYAFTNGSWVLLESASDDITLSEWAEDFTSSFGSPPLRVEPEGGISATMTSGRNLHWWPNSWPRPSVPENYEAFFVTCELRIIHNNNPNVDLYQARYLAGVSSDGYPTTTSGGSGPWPSLSINRHRFITPQWQTFTSYITSFVPQSVDDYENDILSRALPPGVAQPGTPTISIIDPISNTEFVIPEAIEITAVAKDSDGSIDKVEFFIDNQLVGTISEPPYVFSIANPEVGMHQVHAKVFDNEGKEGISYPIFFRILPSQPPVIAITSPAHGQEFVLEEDSIKFSVDASDEDGTISSVVYYLNNEQIAQLNTAPFEFEWTDLTIGNFVLKAEATDDSGISRMSDPVSFTVKAGYSYFNDFTGSDFTGWNFVNGSWRFSASQVALYNSTGNDIEIAVYEPVELFNYYFSADVKPEWKNWSGLLFNYQDSLNYYIVELAISTPPLGVSLIKMENGEPTVLFSSTYTGGAEGVFSNIEILNNNGFTTVRVNKELIFDHVATPDFLQGKIGLYSRWTPATFDNILIIGSIVPDPMANLIVNPDFEIGFEGWTETTGTTEVILDENNLINGTNILKLGPAGWSTAIQKVPVLAETTYVLSTTGLVDAEGRFVRIQLKDAGITMLDTRFDINTTTSTRLWKKFTTKTDSSDDVIVEIYTRENGDYMAYVDNVVLRVYQLPTCSINTESNEISLDQGQALNLDVLAHSEVLEIEKVELYLNGTTLIATVIEEPWSFSVTDLPSGVHTIHALAYDQSNETAQSQTVNVTVTSTVSVIETIQENVKVYPNPARNIVFVRSETENSKLLIINSMGQVVTQKELPGFNNEINISHLPNGLYFVKIMNSNNISHTVKFIKK